MVTFGTSPISFVLLPLWGGAGFAAAFCALTSGPNATAVSAAHNPNAVEVDAELKHLSESEKQFSPVFSLLSMGWFSQAGSPLNMHSLPKNKKRCCLSIAKT